MTGCYDDDAPWTKDSVGKLHKRLGKERAADLQARLEGGDYTAVAEGLLEYYDGGGVPVQVDVGRPLARKARLPFKQFTRMLKSGFKMAFKF